MTPAYLTFIRYQDKRLIPYLYCITLLLLGMYWKNNGYELYCKDVLNLSLVFSLILFRFIDELKYHWAYKCVVKNIDFLYFKDKSTSRLEGVLLHPAISCALAVVVFYLLGQTCLQLSSSIPALITLSVISPLLIYLMFRFSRNGFVKQMRQSVADKVKFRNLHRYVCFNVFITFTMSGLIISPLRHSADFTLSKGYFSASLMVAMWILCVIVLLVNLIFTRPSRRYAFLGRLFLKELDLHLVTGIPFHRLYEKSLWIRLTVLLAFQSLWICLISLILSLVGWEVGFMLYTWLCILPSVSYFYLHVYWLWHNDYLSSCDMYLRCEGIEDKTGLR